MKIERSRERVRSTGEVFTPPTLVNEILDKLDPALFTDPSKTFIDNSCGEGAFLVEVLKRKLKTAQPVQALSTTYGVDLMPDNVEVCRTNLLDLAGHTPENAAIVRRNIVCHDALTYDYEFNTP